MSSNISNMGGTNPAGYNPQVPVQPQAPENQAPAAPQQQQNADPLKFVPGDQYGRAMVNQNANMLPPAVNPQNIKDDVFTFQLMQQFGNELMQGYLARGIEPTRAQQLTSLTMDVLMNPNSQPKGGLIVNNPAMPQNTPAAQ